MDMNMHMHTAMASSAPTSMLSMDSMPGMATTFSINTRVTLFFAEWTTTTPASYVFTIFFLFSLGIFNRFLGALRTQLERRWKEHTSDDDEKTSKILAENKTEPSTIHGHIRRWSRQINPRVVRLEGDEEESEPLSPAPPGLRTHVGEAHEHGARRGFWIPSAPWSLSRDGIRAVLEFLRAVTGYVLMLAVMTYNVGFFFAVTGSVLLGELVLGRYTQSGNKWQEGGCHE